MSAPAKAAKKDPPLPVTDAPANLTEDELAEAARKRAKAAKKAKKREDEAREARLAERIRLAEEALAQEKSKKLGFGTRAQWIVGTVVAVLIFQVVHSAEHVAQATYWLFNPTQPAWMSAWAMGLVNVLGGGPLGMEWLHLIGNAIFLGGLLLAFRLPEQYLNPTMLKWLRLATIVEAAHFAEHVLLTASVLFAGKAVGVSTLFGALTPGTPAAVGYRVTFHLIVNLVVVFFALKAALAVRDARMRRDASSTGQRLDRVGYAVLAAPLAGVIFLLPVFGAHAGHGVAAAGDPAAIVATVNGTDITRGELDTAVALARQLTNVPQLGVATSDPNVQMSEEQVQIATLNRLVQNTLMEQGAADLGITIEDWEVQARKTELIETDFVTREAFDQFLADNNAPEEYATDQVRLLLLQEKVHATLTQDVVFTQEAIQGVYAEQYEGQPRARHLLTDSEAAANKFLTRAQDGENFPEMIRSESMDPRAASTAGYMGPVRQDAAVPEMVQALSGMQDGEYAVVQTQYGWHVVQRITPATLQEVETEIRDNLLLVQQANAGQEWLASIRAAAVVTLESGFGVWDTEFGAVVAEG